MSAPACYALCGFCRDELAAPEDLQAVETIVRGAGTSFYRGMRVLPADRRQAMYAVYAFCRAVDDIADDEGSLAEKSAGLDAWRARIAALYSGGVGDDAVTRVLRAAINRFRLREPDFLAVIDGMQIGRGGADRRAGPCDARFVLRSRRLRSGTAVGARVGDLSEAADRVRVPSGRALQLTNILRDVPEDASRGRLYLPREWLEEAGVPLDPAAALHAAGLGAVCTRVAGLAHAHFAGARAAMQLCDKGAMRPARLMGDTYGALLARIERQGWSANSPASACRSGRRRGSRCRMRSGRPPPLCCRSCWAF